MKYVVKVKLIHRETGRIDLEDSITYDESMLELALGFVVRMANLKYDFYQPEFEIVKRISL